MAEYLSGERIQGSKTITVDKLKGYYKFDEASGNFINKASSVGSTDAWSNDITTTGSPTYQQSGVIDYSLHMTGISGTASPSFDWTAEDWSVSVWGKITSGAGTGVYRGLVTIRYISSGSSATQWWTIGTNNNGKCGYETGGGTYELFETGSDFDGEGWAHFALTYDASEDELKFYLDGVLKDTHTTATLGSTSNLLGIGQWSGNNANVWNGNIDELGIWNKVLDQTTITSLYNSGNGKAIQDEKDTITNVPVGTRFEETDTRKIYRMTEKATSSQSTGSTGGWEYVMNTGQTNWSVDFMGQKFEADHELIGATIDSISFDLSKNGSVADVLKLAKANSSNTITVLESIPISSVSSSGSGSGNTANFTTMTFDSFTPFVLQANDKLGIYASGTMGGNSSDSNCSGACTYVEIAHTSSNVSANETRYGIANNGTYFTTGDFSDDIKYSIGVSPSMKIWKERGVAT